MRKINSIVDEYATMIIGGMGTIIMALLGVITYFIVGVHGGIQDQETRLAELDKRTTNINVNSWQSLHIELAVLKTKVEDLTKAVERSTGRHMR